MEEGFVYKWTDSSNGMVYIGSHNGSPNDGYIGSGVHFNRAYNKRPECFSREVIYFGEDFRELEEFILEEYDAKNNTSFYNLKNSAIGGDTFSGKTHTKEARNKISQSRKGKTWNKESRLKMSASRKNKNTKKVYCGVLQKEFKSATDCAKELNVSPQYIRGMIYGDNKNIFNVRYL